MPRGHPANRFCVGLFFFVVVVMFWFGLVWFGIYNSKPQEDIQKREVDLKLVEIMGVNDITERECAR